MTDIKGRLVYIEPNELRAEEGTNFGNGDNLTWNPEDLHISVDLQVAIPNRDDCGQTDIGDKLVWDATRTNGDKFVFSDFRSFLTGTHLRAEKEPYLTDEYTNISYQEIRDNKAGGKESLGIKSIDIVFNPHFFPEVTINMVDVRGYSLMMPEEEAMDNKGDGDACKRFFTALFHFPYPRFALSVKGFYGERVTFCSL